MIEQYRIETPEAVNLEYTPAGLGSRFIALCLDYLLMVLLFIVLGTVAGTIIAVGGQASRVLVDIVLITGTFLIFWGYFVAFETIWMGQTPGKRTVGIRVMKTSGLPIGFIDALIRNLVRIVDWLPLLYAVGLIFMFVSKESRRLGDYAAGTLVVWEASSVRLDELSREIVRPFLGAYAPENWDLSHLNAEDLVRIRHFLSIAPLIRPEFIRPRRAGYLAAGIAPRIGASPPGEMDAENFLAAVMARGDESAQAAERQSIPAIGGEEGWRLRGLAQADLAMMQDFLGRAGSLRTDARKKLANQIATVTAAKVEAQVPGDPETFIRRVLILAREGHHPG